MESEGWRLEAADMQLLWPGNRTEAVASPTLEAAMPGACPAGATPTPVPVQVWAGGLDLPVKERDRCFATLSDSEREQAARFRFEVHRDRFVVARALLRSILGRYLGCAPRAVEFTYGPKGKPQLVGQWLHFNLSHSEDLALVAVSPGGAVGVDVEKMRPVSQMEELVQRFFSAREHREFEHLSASERLPAFFRLWTRKEAWLKATGKGLSGGLDQVEVSFRAGRPAQLLSLPAQAGALGDWQLLDLAPASGFAAALVLASPAPMQVKCAAWE